MKSPSAPDPMVTAQQQMQFNTQAAGKSQQMNMIDQSGPGGSMKYVQTGTYPDGTPKYELKTELSAGQQQLYDANNTAKLSGTNLMNALLNSKNGALSGNPLDLSYGNIEANMGKLWHSQNDPYIAQQKQAFEQGLVSKGLDPNSEGYRNQMMAFQDQLGRNQNAAMMANHQQAVSDLTGEYNSGRDTMSALLGYNTSAQGPTQNNTPTSNIQSPDYMGAVQKDYEAQTKQYGAAMGGLFGLGGSIAGGLIGGPFGSGIGKGIGGMIAGGFGGK